MGGSADGVSWSTWGWGPDIAGSLSLATWAAIVAQADAFGKCSALHIEGRSLSPLGILAARQGIGQHRPVLPQEVLHLAGQHGLRGDRVTRIRVPQDLAAVGAHSVEVGVPCAVRPLNASTAVRVWSEVAV